MLRLVFIVLHIVALGLPSFAQDDFDVSKKTIGNVTRWNTHNGKTSVTFLGREGRYFLLEFERDDSKGDPAA